MAEKVYRNVVGIVQFEPREGDAGGKAVRNITVRQTGFGPMAVRVSATLWPSHAHVEVAEGDVVSLEGSYTKNEKTNEETGDKIVFHNISVSRIAVLGKSDAGSKAETGNTQADDSAADDDIPF